MKADVYWDWIVAIADTMIYFSLVALVVACAAFTIYALYKKAKRF